MIDYPEFRDALNYLRSQYEILGVLGRDGPGVVCRGWDLTMRREVAIRLRRLPSGADSIPRLTREVDLLAKVWHPNIVALYGVHKIPDGTVAFIMQFGSWQVLSEVIHRAGPMPVEQTVHVLRDVATALVHLHGHGLVHQRVSPRNIFLDEESGRAMLSDFAIDGEDEGGDAEPTREIVGAFAHLSSRQIDGSGRSRMRDLRGLGLVGYEMLLGGRTGEVANPELPSLATIRPDVPAQLRQTIELAVLGNQSWRYPSVEAFLAQLELTAESTGYTRRPERAASGSAMVLMPERRVEGAAVRIRPPRVLGRSGLGAAVMVVAFIVWLSARFSPDQRSESLPSATTAVLPTAPGEPARVGGAALDEPAARVDEPISAPVASPPDPGLRRPVSAFTELPEVSGEDPTPSPSEAALPSGGPLRRVDLPTRVGPLRLAGTPVLLGVPVPQDTPNSPGRPDS